tara:strand:- start:12117 stop:12515 length:399 start_codon:yes stop_codon:yes gene_type:complete
LTASASYSQERPPPAISYRGTPGIFLTEAQARQAAQDRIKGIAYFKNWKISEAQLQDKDLRIQNLEEENILITEAWTGAEADLEGSDLLVLECKGDRNEIQTLLIKEKKKTKLLPWIAGGAFILGVVLGSLK